MQNPEQSGISRFISRKYGMRKNLKRENLIKSFTAGMCLLLTGCGTIGLAREATYESAYEAVKEEEPVNIYTSKAYGVLQAVDVEEGTITLYLPEEKEERTFQYDGTTTVEDRFGSALSMAQLMPGEIVDVSYNSDLKKAGSVALPSEAWSYDGVSRYNLDIKRGILRIGSNTYSLLADTKIFSDTEQIELNQILNQDILSIKGLGHEIISVVVDKGHGYLDLKNDEALIGGWIEVGQAVIQQISQDMLITVPEGSYSVRLTSNGIEETREVLIERNKETVLDLGDIKIEQPTSGRVVFSIEPEDADVYVDGIRVDTSYTIRLPFGIHQVSAGASGYDSITEYFNVEGETTTVRLILDEAEEETVTVSGNETEEETYTITIESPEDVEVYQDNLYMGIAPVTYTKTAGSHTITLRKTGYVTKSYNIEIEDDDKDVKYSFPDLEPEETSSATGSTVSGNTVSGNSSSSTGKKSDSNKNNEKTVSGNITTVSGNDDKTVKSA